jgi:hypothetical protein
LKLREMFCGFVTQQGTAKKLGVISWSCLGYCLTRSQ